MTVSQQNNKIQNQADWELDFYSRPILEPDGKKRWELLIINSPEFKESKSFLWEKKCPAGEVNSIWLTEAFKEALEECKKQGWEPPKKLRCWRTSMKTMITKAATKVGIEVVASRRTYALLEWLLEREQDFYPKQEGYIAGPYAPATSPLLNQPIPLPEAVRGDAWNLASLPLGMLREVESWPMEFSSLIPIRDSQDETIKIPGLRLFSKTRALALAGWLGGLEPVKLVVESNQLILEAGQEDRWLVTDLPKDLAIEAKENFESSRKKASGLQFIAVQTSPEIEFFEGFWMMKDLHVT